MPPTVADPSSFASIGNARASKENAQWWLLLAIVVAGKQADTQQYKLQRFIHSIADPGTPFEKIRSIDAQEKLREALVGVKMGQYNRIERTFRAVASAHPDPREWSLETLEAFPGIGPKTARWFYLLVNPTAMVAALDTHVLKFLRDNGYPDAPKGTPSKGKEYHWFEMAFCEKAVKIGTSIRDLDYFAWAIYRKGGKILIP